YEWLIMSPDQLGKLIGRNGQPLIRPDIVLCDESQLYRHVSAKRTRYMRRICRLDQEPDKAPFVINLTATPGHDPSQYSYLSALFAQIHGEPAKDWSDLGARLIRMGFPLEKGWDPGKYQWAEEAKQSTTLQTRAVTTVRSWMTSTTPPVALHRAAPWGQAPIDGMPVEFTADQWASYEADWGEFQTEMRL